MAFIYFRGKDIHCSPSRGSWYANEEQADKKREEVENRKYDRGVDGVLHSRAMRSDRETAIEKENRDFGQTGRDVE